MFNKGEFISHSGNKLKWKIECDDLSDDDLDCMANLISNRYDFCEVYGVPTGGERIAEYLKMYRKKDSDNVLVVDDVLTTGASMEQARASLKGKYPGKKLKGLVLFTRGRLPQWVDYLILVNPKWW